jgi:hypothetical protein
VRGRVESGVPLGTVGAMSNGGVASGPSVSVPHCPIGGEALQLGSSGEVDHWSCPAGHGLALTLSEGHARLQDDEVAELWQRARAAGPGPLDSPFGRRRMVRLELPYDADELPTDAPGGGQAPAGVVVLDVDLEEQFIWFDAGELDALPEDLANAAPAAEVLAREAEIRARFGADVEDALAARDDHELTERLYQRLARRPQVLRTLDSVGRGLTTY